jgi:hypothetical protein
MTPKIKSVQPSPPLRSIRILRSQEKMRGASLPPDSRQTTDRRSHERVHLRIPVRLRMLGKEIRGYTFDLSSAGLRIISHMPLAAGTPMSMQFCFGGETCYPQIVGQMVFCRNIVLIHPVLSFCEP